MPTSLPFNLARARFFLRLNTLNSFAEISSLENGIPPSTIRISEGFTAFVSNRKIVGAACAVTRFDRYGFHGFGVQFEHFRFIRMRRLDWICKEQYDPNHSKSRKRFF